MKDNMFSKHFVRSEFACKCKCGEDTIDAELVNVLDDLREYFGKVIVTSGARCSAYNFTIGGKPSSQHLIGRAADIVVPGVEARTVSAYLLAKYPDSYGIGVYDNFTHIDTRSKKARW